MQNPHNQGGHPQPYLAPSSQQQQYNQLPSQATLNSAFQNQGLPPHYGNPYGVPHQSIQPHHHYQNVIPQPQPIQPLSHQPPPLLSSSATASGLPLGAQSTSPEMYPGSASSKKKRSQVKNACINCQKACKKCDDGRPCSRCVKYGLSDTCQDSQRKERKKGIKRGPYKRRQNVNSLIAAGGQEPQHETTMPQQQDYQQHSQVPFPYPAQAYEQFGYQYSRPHVESQSFPQQYSSAGYQQPMSSGLPMHSSGAGTTGGYPFMMPAQNDNFLTTDQDHYQGGHHHHQQQSQSQPQQQQHQHGPLILEQGIQPQPVGLTTPHNMTTNPHMMLPTSSASASGNGMGAAANHHGNENGSIGGAALTNAVERREKKLNVLSELCSAVLDKNTDPQPSPTTESSPPIGSPLDAPELTPALTDATTSTSADEPKWDRPAGFPFSSKPQVSAHHDQYQWVGHQPPEHGGAVPLYMPHAMY